MTYTFIPSASYFLKKDMLQSKARYMLYDVMIIFVETFFFWKANKRGYFNLKSF